MSHLQSPSNRYLKWLEKPHKAAPYPYRANEWKMAWEIVLKDYKKHCRALRAGAGVENFEGWQQSGKKLHILARWMEFCGGHVGSGGISEQKELQKSIKSQEDKNEKELPEFRQLLTKMARHRSLSQEVRARIRLVRDTLVTYKKDILDVAEPALERQQQRFLNTHPGLELPSSRLLLGLPSPSLNISRKVARSRGVNGVVVERSGPVIKHALETCVNREVRESIWKMRQESCLSTDRSARRLFEARQVMAKKYGYDSFAAHELSTRMHPSPRSLLSGFEKSLNESVDLLNDTDKWLENYGRTHCDIQKSEAWDTSFLIHAASCSSSGEFPMAEFPWVKTLEKAIPELVGVVGWKVQKCEVRGKHTALMVHWELSRNDQVHHLWVAPFQGGGINDLNIEGDADFFRAGPNNVMHGFVRLYRNHKTPGFDFHTLLTLAHEVGHILHWLSIPPSAGLTVQGPADLTEIPSVLLEHYPKDPQVLRRWSSNSRRSIQSWSKHAESVNLLHMRASVLNNISAWIDLSVTTTPPESLKELIKSLPGRFGLKEQHPSDRGWMEYAVWLGYGASDYMYHLAYSVNHRLHPELGANPKAAKIAKAFRRLENQVLSRSHLTPRVIHESWRNLTGETLLQSLKKGSKTQTRSWKSKLRTLEV